LFGEFVVQAYSFRFKDLSGEAFRVGKSRELNARDTLVFSRFVRVNGEPVRVNWRVRRNGEKYRVVDVVVEGMSMLITQRDEFAAVINSAGGKIEGLLAALRRKTGKSR
jgi:phospholipid transport system substrate-binding protein